MSERFSRQRRRVILGAAAFATTGATGALVSVQALAAEQPTISLQLGYTAGGDQIAEVAAKHMGYFRDEGLDLSIHPGGPSVDGLAIVAAGGVQLGEISSSPSVMMAVSQGIPVRCFAAGLQRHPYAYFSLRKSPVRSAQDLIGKKIGVPPTGVVLLRLLLAKNHIPENKVTVVPVGGDMSPLLTGQVDVVTGWLTNIPALKVLGSDRVDLSLWDAGVHLYAWPYYATQATLSGHPEILVKFLRATARGWHFCRTQPDQAVELLLKDYQQLNREDERAALAVKLTYALSEETHEHGWGTMTTARWQDQITQFQQLGQFAGHVPTVAEVMTTFILEQTQAVRMTV